MFDLEMFWKGLLFTSAILACMALPYLTLYFARFLAQRDVFFTMVEEGTVKAIMINKKFRHFAMSYRGHKFKGGHDHETEWLIETFDEPSPGEEPFWSSLIGGLKWIGIWPFATVHQYKMRWSSIEQQKGDRSVVPTLEYNTKEEMLTALLVRADVYALVLKDLEVKGGLPVSMGFAIRIAIENPYKALFRIEKWLEATLDQLGAELRRILAHKTYEELLEFRNEMADLGNVPEVKVIIDDVRARFGAKIERTQLLVLDPNPEFVKLTLLKYQAEEEAKAVIARAGGEAKRVEIEYGAIQKAPNGIYLKTLEVVKGSTLVLGGKNLGDIVSNFQIGSVPPAPPKT